MEQVVIKKLDNFVRGITTIDNKICFIPYALPGGVYEIELVKDKKNYSEGKIVKVIEESNLYTKPLCPYFYLCGGCQLMNLDRNSGLNFKEEKVKELIKRFVGIDIKINPIISGEQFNYRNKLTLHGSNSKIGLYQEKTHDVIEIDKCIITSNKINDIVSRLNKYSSLNEVSEIVIKNTSLDEVMISIDGNFNIEEFIDSFKDVNSIYINKKLVYGKESITEVINDLYFEIYPTSFFQVNYLMMLEMYNKVIDFYKKNTNLKVLDLYCGTGTIGMLVSKYCKSVCGIEINEEAIISANKCKEKNNISNIEFICGSVEDNIDRFNDIDSIIVDPPRSGLDNHTIDTIIRINPSSIIYVSCDPVTLARDLNILKENYNIKEITPIDMFPNTYHVETVCLLTRKSL